MVTGRILGLRPEELAGLRLHLTYPGRKPIPVRIDALGRYRTEALLPKDYDLIVDIGLRRLPCELSLAEEPEVQARSWCTPQDEAPEDAPTSRPVVLEDGSAAVELDLILPPLFEVSGRALSPAGKPVAGMRIEFSPHGGEHGPLAWSLADGSFSTRLESGRYCVATYPPDGNFPAEPRPLRVAEAAISGLDLTLRPLTVIRGRVRGQEAGEWVYIDAESTEGWEASGEVDPDGEFRIELGPGEWEVLARTFRPYKRAVGRVVVPSGAAKARLNLELQPATQDPLGKAQKRPERDCQLPPLHED